MTEDVKTLLGSSASNYTEAQIELCLEMAKTEVETYCRCSVDDSLKTAIKMMAVIKLNRLGSEGLASQSYSGVSENYINGYPAEVLEILKRKRKVKML